MGLKRKTTDVLTQTTDELPQTRKKKPHRKEPYWSTSKAFVAALTEENKINAVTEWLRAINEQLKIEKSTNGLTNGDAEELEGFDKDNSDKNEDNEDQTEEGEASVPAEKRRKNMQISTERFADVIAPYIDAFFKAGGSVSPLLSCGRLETSHLCTLFQALYHIIIRGKVLGVIDTSWIAGECIEFLKMNADSTRHMLSTLRSARQNQLALEFLLAMTAVDNQVAIEVLSVADFKETNVRYMAHETILSVRKAYINLMTGLLVCGDPTVIRAIIIRPYLVTSIMESLVWDPADVVATFLTAIRCHLVQNRTILKVKKSEIFPGDVLTALLRLYRWGGPANKPATLAHLSKKAKAKSARPLIEVDQEELQTVTSSVHALLMVLFTDHTFGLVYKDPAIGTKAQRNYLLSHVFKYLERPWNIPALGELFVRTLVANPDVMKIVLQSMKPALEPRAMKEWSKCIDLVEKVITELHPEKIIEESLGDLSLANLMSVVVDLCTPQILVGVLCGPNGDNFLGMKGGVTHRIAQFLSHMLANLSKVLDRMLEWREQGKLSENEIIKVRRFVTEFLLRHFPPFSTMLKSCLTFMRAPDEMKGLEDDSVSPTEDAVKENTSMLKLLLVYLKLCSKDDSSIATADAENHKILMDMFETLHLESNHYPYIRYDFYELLLTLKEPSFAIENETMREHVTTLFSDVLNRDEDVASKAKNVLVKLIRNAGLFEGNTNLPVIWLDLCRKHLRIHDLELMMESVVRAASDPAGYRHKIDKADEKTIEKMSFNENLEESLGYQAEEIYHLFKRWEKEDPVLGSKGNILCSVSYELHSISPWLPALLDVLKEHQETQTSKQLARRQEFLRHLLTTTLFHSSQTATLLYLIIKRDRRDQTLPSDLVDYFKSWRSKGSPQPLFIQNNFISTLTKFLLLDNAHKLDDVNMLNSFIRQEILEGKDGSVAREDVVYMVRVVVFHVVELSQRGMLTSQVSQRCGQSLCVALSIAQELHGEVLRQCLQIFLSNFNVISHFTPFGDDHCASSKNLTSTVVMVIGKANVLCEDKNDESMYSVLKSPFKYKLLKSLKYERKLYRPLHKKARYMVGQFQFSFEEISELLTSIVELPRWTSWIDTTTRSFSSWGAVASLLLERAAGSEEAAALPDAIVSKLSTILKCIKNDDVTAVISPLEKGFLNYLKFRPQQTKCVDPDLLPTLFRQPYLESEGYDLAIWLCKRFNKGCVAYLQEAMLPELDEGLPSKSELIFEAMKWASQQVKENEKCVPYESGLALISRYIRCIITNETDYQDWLAPYIDFATALLAKHKKYAVGKAALYGLLEKPPEVTLFNFSYVDLIGALFWNLNARRSLPKLTVLYLGWIINHLQKHEKSEEDVTLITKLCRVVLKRVPLARLNPSDTSAIKSEDKDTKGDGKEASGNRREGRKRDEKSLLKEMKKKRRAEVKIRWDAVLDSETWMKYVPLALMFGLQSTDTENESKGTETRALVLRTLCLIIEEIYGYRPDSIQLATIFKLAVQHSEFQVCMTTLNPVRLELAKLLKILIELSPSLMEGAHFPILLTSYRATMDPADRLILQLLDKYESAGIVPPKYRSFLWGEDGASMYATTNEKNALVEFDPNKVFNLLSSDVVQKTLFNFPLSRTLNVHENDETLGCSEVYDPAFYLPILSNVTSPESPLKTFVFVRSGALALTLVSLSSEVENIRKMAYSILTGFVDHLYMSKGMQVEVLNRFMDSLRIGVTSLMKGDEASSPRISSIVAIFLARTSLAICHPLAPMFTPLNSFLLSKVEINLECVPEFLACMHSSSADFRCREAHLKVDVAVVHRTRYAMYRRMRMILRCFLSFGIPKIRVRVIREDIRDQRTWMLENLENGLRSPMDFALCLHNEVPIFRLLMDMFTSCVSDIDTKLRILKVMTAAIALDDGASWLAFNFGLISWLGIACQYHFIKNSGVVNTMVVLIATLWKTLVRLAAQYIEPARSYVRPRTSGQLLRILLLFVPSMSSMETETLPKFLSSITDIYEAGAPGTLPLLNQDVVNSIIKASSTAFPSDVVTKCSSILMFGCDYLLDEDENKEEGVIVNEAEKELERLAKTWVRLKKESKQSLLQ